MAARLPTKEALLRTVRDFMTGTNQEGESVTRKDLVKISPRLAVHVGMAMIVARPDRFLETRGSTNYIKGNFDHTLTDLLCVGVPDSTLGSSALVGLCRDAGLYASEPGRGGHKRLQPSLPADLSALVEELKNHPAVDAFFKEVDEALRIHRLPKPTTVTGDDPSPQIRAGRVLAWLNEQDPDAVHALRTLLDA